MFKCTDLHQQLEIFLNKDDGIDFNVLSNWAYEAWLEGLNRLPEETLNLLEELAISSMGPEFEWSKNDLEQLLEKLNQN